MKPSRHGEGTMRWVACALILCGGCVGTTTGAGDAGRDAADRSLRDRPTTADLPRDGDPPGDDAVAPGDTLRPDLPPPTVPGGKQNFVVALGVLIDGSRENRVRLGTYAFDGASGTVAAQMYFWTQKNPVERVPSGTTPSGGCAGTASTVPACDVLVPDGYMGAPNDVRSGTFQLAEADGKPYVGISWPAAPGKTWTEQWWIAPSDDGRYARLTLKYSNGATHGFGYGSNAALATRRALSSVLGVTTPLRYQYAGWAHDSTVEKTTQWTMSLYGQCTSTTHVATYHQPSSSTACKSGCVPPHDSTTAIEYYILKVSSYDRRDHLWHWCRCLAQGGTCYFGNSHVKPMLQVIDDQGAWRGWVGVEASFYPYASADPRGADMLMVWTVFEGAP